jgi:integrase
MNLQQTLSFTTLLKNACSLPNADENIHAVLTLIADSIKNELQGDITSGKLTPAEMKYIEGKNCAKFTEKELEKMTKEFRKSFKTHKLKAHVRKTKDNIYEVRCVHKGHIIQGTSKDLVTAKEKFITRLNEIDFSRPPTKGKRSYLVDYMEEWLETAKKPFIKESTYGDYQQTFKAYIKPHFEGKKLTQIKYFELQDYLNEFSNAGKHRTAKKIYQLLSTMFDYAVADGIIPRTPMAKIKLMRYEQEHGVPLTIDEESAFIKDFYAKPDIYNQAFAFILYTGIRRSELATATIDENWIYIATSKQRKGMKDKIRAIPISPMLAKVLPYINFDEIKTIPVNVLTNRFRKLCPGHHLHDLRHTFVTRAQECGIKREYVSLWAGHKADNSITSNVYTHLGQNKEVQIAEMKKYDYPLIATD